MRMEHPEYFQDVKVDEISSDDFEEVQVHLQNVVQQQTISPVVTKKRRRVKSDTPILEKIYKQIRLANDEINHFTRQYSGLGDTFEAIDALISDDMDVDVVSLIENYMRLKVKLHHHKKRLYLAQNSL
mgnify:CR=1 FL=1